MLLELQQVFGDKVQAKVNYIACFIKNIWINWIVADHLGSVPPLPLLLTN